MKKAMVLVLVVFGLLFLPAGTAFAATTQDVAINATPTYIAIANSPDNYGFGLVAASSNASTTERYFNVTDSSTVNTDVSIGCNATWAGGEGWTHSDTATIGTNQTGMKASDGDSTFDIIVKNSSPNDLVGNNVAGTDWDWELRLMAPSAFTDGVLKTNTVTLTATAT